MSYPFCRGRRFGPSFPFDADFHFGSRGAPSLRWHRRELPSAPVQPVEAEQLASLLARSNTNVVAWLPRSWPVTTGGSPRAEGIQTLERLYLLGRPRRNDSSAPASASRLTASTRMQKLAVVVLRRRTVECTGPSSRRRGRSSPGLLEITVGSTPARRCGWAGRRLVIGRGLRLAAGGWPAAGGIGGRLVVQQFGMIDAHRWQAAVGQFHAGVELVAL